MNDVPICLMYGKEDPWVKPIWGLQVKRQLPEAPYYELSPAGHCPHDEVPEVCSLSPISAAVYLIKQLSYVSIFLLAFFLFFVDIDCHRLYRL